MNSKYIHSSLAPWYLKAICGEGCGEVKVLEHTINDSIDMVLASIYNEKADVAAFSCYIWNIAYVLSLCSSLKKVSPGIVIVLGGPEVSFDSHNILGSNPEVDFVISGEGEAAFKKLLENLHSGGSEFKSIDGLAFREHALIVVNRGCSLVEDLGTLPSPYSDEMISGIGNRIVYFEASRGCPFSCSYCISSTFEGVRFFPLDRVINDLNKLIDAGAHQVKFVDRTFNCSRQRAKEIFRFIAGLPEEISTNFHFEAAADLFDEEMLDILRNAPHGRIQFEIGIQTVNEETLRHINRKTHLKKVFANINRLISMGNMHIHLDLIAGLPAEDYQSFKNSFNAVYRLQPQEIQLGFLKMLKGAKIREQAKEYGYKYRDYAPYEILCNKYISFEELLELKGIEEMLDRYFNSSRFVHTLKYIIGNYFSSPFDFFLELFLYSRQAGFYQQKLSSRQMYTVLMDFMKGRACENDLRVINELLKLDYLSSDSSGNLPQGIERRIIPVFKEMCFEFLKDEKNVEKYLPEFRGMPAKQIFKQVHFELLAADENLREKVIMFNYSRKDAVTGLFNYWEVSLEN
ncbi:MAG: B12-binding domain-containing radical SAM protein [Clostridia bacterium]|nr:B12-binding domain-containing radical SAM protein [Clostridia bacterium]